jgi:hypothetical protein
MKFDHGILAVALAIFAAEVQGQLTIQYTDVSTYAEVQAKFGSSEKQYKLQLNTGAANTWVGASTPYSATGASVKTGDTVAVQEGAGSFSGDEYMDTITLGSTTFNQSIGVAKTSVGYDATMDGVLGLGPAGLTKGTLSPDTTTEIPTVLDNLFSSGSIDSNKFTVGMVSDDSGYGTGTVTFGSPLVEIDSVKYAPLTTTAPANQYWGIDASFSYGGKSLVAETAGIVDYSTTLLMLDTASYNGFVRETGARHDSATGLPAVTQANFNKLSPIIFKIGGSTINLSTEDYIWPRNQNAYIGGSAENIYLAIGDLGTAHGSGLDFIIGYNTLKHFNVVFDAANSQVGFSALDIAV